MFAHRGQVETPERVAASKIFHFRLLAGLISQHSFYYSIKNCPYQLIYASWEETHASIGLIAFVGKPWK